MAYKQEKIQQYNQILRNYWRYFKIDTSLFLLIIILSAFGIITLYSSSSWSVSTMQRQLMHLAISIASMLFIAQIPPYLLKRYSPYFMLAGIILLILTIFFGVKSGGAQRWLDFGIIRFQPSELMKIIMPIAIASILSGDTLPPKISSIMLSIVAIIIATVLIAKQPDLGTAILIGASGVYVLFFSGIRIRIIKNIWLNILLIISFLSSSLFIFWNYLLIPYQKKRILTLIDPSSDPLGSGYHILQSKIAIGSGGLLGKGLGAGSQSQLNFLPEHTTDFIFAVIAEELGFVGVLFLLIMYCLIIYRCFKISKQTQDNFARLLGASLTMIFFTYIFVNIGMVSGILPVVGVPLPLISYGGSSLITIMSSFGVIMSIHKHSQQQYTT